MKKRPIEDVIAIILSAGTPPDIIEHLLGHADECDKLKPGSGELFRDAVELIAELSRRLSQPGQGWVNVERLAAIIRKVDGDHSLGASELAEKILAELSSPPEQPPNE